MNVDTQSCNVQGDRETSLLYIQKPKKWYKLYNHKDQVNTHRHALHTRRVGGGEERERERERGGRGRERDFASKCQIIILRKLNSLLSSMTDFGYGRTF